jgi:3-(3-hydroxy-phenyl)propionate hydroxylase
MSVAEDRWPVAIVGFGPGGQALASLLGRCGHRVLVLERWTEPYNLPRMSTLDGEIARLLQHAADPGEALAQATPHTEVEMYGSDEARIATIDWSDTRGGHPSHLSVHQPDIESAMMTRIDTMPAVDVRWGTTVTGLEQDDDGVVVTATGPNGTASVVRADYVVGMDGASSFVRGAAGIGLDVIHRHEDRWVMTDFDIVDDLPDRLGARYIFNLDFDTPFFFGPNGANRCRADVRVAPGVSDADVLADVDGGYRFMRERLGVPGHLLRQTRRIVYRFRSQMAERFREGRVFIGGDAAHAMTPFLGQGACTAMRDSANLGWKLDLVLKGVADQSLLDTYEGERWEHDAQFVHGSFGMWGMASPSDRESAEARNEYMQQQDGELGMFIEPLANGILRTGTDGRPGRLAGELAPQGRVTWFGRTALLDDLVGYGFQLVIRDRSTAEEFDLSRVEARLGELGARVVVLGGEGDSFADVDGVYEAFFRDADAVAFIGRPDFYLFGVAGDVPDVRAMVDDLLGQLEPPGTPDPALPTSDEHVVGNERK